MIMLASDVSVTTFGCSVTWLLMLSRLPCRIALALRQTRLDQSCRFPDQVRIFESPVQVNPDANQTIEIPCTELTVN